MGRLQSKFKPALQKTRKLIGDIKRKLRRPKPKNANEVEMHGKRLELNPAALDVHSILKKHITQDHLDTLKMNQKEFLEAMQETERRLAGQKSTVNQCVGTFLEVVGPQHPDVITVRHELVLNNLEIALQHGGAGEKRFLQAATSRINEKGGMNGQSLDFELPWKDTKLEARYAREKVALDKRFDDDLITQEMHQELSEKLTRKRAENFDGNMVIEVRDLTIDGVEYCDRAVLLKAKSGKWLILLTEEYKTRASGGVNAQTSIRDTRLFNDTVGAESKLGFFPIEKNANSRFYEGVGAKKPEEISFKDLYLNSDTTTSDRVATKARSSGDTDYEIRALTVTRSVKERKSTYGEKARKGSISDTAYYFVGLGYPGHAIRSMFQEVWNKLPN